MKNRKIFFIFEGRFPSEKAGSLFAAKSCEAFVNLGYEPVVLVPRRVGRVKQNYKDYYKISADFPVKFLPTVDLFGIPVLSHIAFRVALFTFSLSTFFYLLFTKKSQDIAYSNALVPLYFASLTGAPAFYEVHDFPEKKLFFSKHMLRRMKWILSTNQWKKDKLKEIFALSDEKILVEPNAVELESFGREMTKTEARAHLSLPDDKPIVLYTGHLYGWKGVDTLAQSAKFIPNANIYFVGGTKEDSKRFLKEYGDTPNIRLIGHRPHTEIPYWQSAADILVLPNTAKEKISAFYTSPMKLFEYMASGRPIVASDLPSIRQITGDDTVVLCEPDNPRALADSIMRTLGDAVLCDKVSRLAKERVKEHTWEKRARRIVDFMALSRP